MLKLQGKYNEAKVFTNNVDETATGQIIDLCNQEFVKDSQIRIMPDTHAGAGCTIGTTMTIQDKIFGKGNPDWNFSGPHGAGRIMSRKKAKELLSLEDFQNTMKEVWTTSVVENTIDEAPMVYKPMDEIITNTKETIDIKHIIKPLYNFKAN